MTGDESNARGAIMLRPTGPGNPEERPRLFRCSRPMPRTDSTPGGPVPFGKTEGQAGDVRRPIRAIGADSIDASRFKLLQCNPVVSQPGGRVRCSLVQAQESIGAIQRDSRHRLRLT